MKNPTFDLHIGIDYSGAKTPVSRLSGLQVYAATTGVPVRVFAANQHKNWNWNRQEIALWLVEQARSGQRFIAGIDHAFSFPLNYFQRYKLNSWTEFLEDFVRHWPTNDPRTHVDLIRHREEGPPDRIGSSADFRLTELWTSSAKSIFQFDVQGSVAKSTLSGLPWLQDIRHELGDLVHVWPFDGWQVREGRSVIAEVYPSLFRKRFPSNGRTPDQQDAYSIARWLKETDERGLLPRYFDPPLTDEERTIANLEGWILGIS